MRITQISILLEILLNISRNDNALSNSMRKNKSSVLFCKCID